MDGLCQFDHDGGWTYSLQLLRVLRSHHLRPNGLVGHAWIFSSYNNGSQEYWE